MVIERGVRITVWWMLKELSTVSLIGIMAYTTVRYPYESSALPLSQRVAVAIVLFGGTIHLWSSALLKSRVKNLVRPENLLTDRGLYRFVRHPMYFGQSIVMTGFLCYSHNVAAYLVYGVGLAAVLMQAHFEDRYLAVSFGKTHAAWAWRTRLVIPYMY